MKTIIAGSRSATAHDVSMAMNDCPFLHEITEVVSGCAFPADWTIGKGAGVIRNQVMADYADALVGIWDGDSRGTKNMLAEAKNGIRTFLWRI